MVSVVVVAVVPKVGASPKIAPSSVGASAGLASSGGEFVVRGLAGPPDLFLVVRIVGYVIFYIFANKFPSFFLPVC